MRRISFDPQQLTGTDKAEWDAWQTEADCATADAIQAWEDWRANGSPGTFKYNHQDRVWKKLKDFLLKRVFHDKCAYCEHQETRSPYHAEHFRPKGGVTFRTAGKKKTFTRATILDENGSGMEHPGYFWLAYRWENLLPSCTFCNTANGKKEQFPVALSHVGVRRLTTAEIAALLRNQTASLKRPGVYYLHPDDLDVLEQPLLLNPYFDDPSQHLRFGDCGLLSSYQNSPRGEASMAVFDLTADALTRSRQEVCDKALSAYMLAYTPGGQSIAERKNKARAAVAGYIDGSLPYSAAVLAFLRLNFPDHGL